MLASPLLAAFLGLTLTPTSPHGAHTLVQDVRQALHVDRPADASEIRLSGHAHIYGTDVRYELTFQPTGRFAQRFVGVLGEQYGNDGTQMWKTNREGVSRPLAFEDVDESLGETLLLTDRWAEPGFEGRLSEEGGALRLKLPGGLDERIVVDPTTHLPQVATFPLSAGPVTIKLSDWREVGGRKYPFQVQVTETQDLREYDVERGATQAPSKPATFAMPPRKRLDVSFERGKPADVEVRRAISGHMLVKPLVNGKDVGWFIFDSGAESMCIDPKVADGLGLAKVGTLPITGIGGTVKGSFRPVPRFTLGPATMRNVYFVELDLAEIGKFLGVPLAGVIGDEFLDRTIDKVDVAKPAISIFDPSSYQLPAGASWSPLRFESGNPLVEATANGKLTGWYRFDTGDPGTVTFHAPYVEREHLLEGRETEASASGGVGGVVGARAGKIPLFTLAGHEFKDLSVGFSLAKEGAFADLYVAGNIGQWLMRPFTVVFDFGGSRIALLPK